MPPKCKPIAELGQVQCSGGTFRAHVQNRDAAGLRCEICGPRREQRRRAETDLDQMRAAGAVGSTREQGLQYMSAEARRPQVSASFEAEVRAAVQRQLAEEEEEDAVYVSDEEPEEDDPWLLENPSNEDLPATPPTQR